MGRQFSVGGLTERCWPCRSRFQHGPSDGGRRSWRPPSHQAREWIHWGAQGFHACDSHNRARLPLYAIPSALHKYTNEPPLLSFLAGGIERSATNEQRGVTTCHGADGDRVRICAGVDLLGGFLCTSPSCSPCTHRCLSDFQMVLCSVLRVDFVSHDPVECCACVANAERHHTARCSLLDSPAGHICWLLLARIRCHLFGAEPIRHHRSTFTFTCRCCWGCAKD